MLYTYKNMDSRNHAEKGTLLARTILDELKITSGEETNLICASISHHSDKANTNSQFDEILKDADVLQHNLYNTNFVVENKEKIRYLSLVKELDFQ